LSQLVRLFWFNCVFMYFPHFQIYLSNCLLFHCTEVGMFSKWTACSTLFVVYVSSFVSKQNFFPL
jgi:hypothetical protein